MKNDIFSFYSMCYYNDQPKDYKMFTYKVFLKKYAVLISLKEEYNKRNCLKILLRLL
jgi:hypothetical protein